MSRLGRALACLAAAMVITMALPAHSYAVGENVLVKVVPQVSKVDPGDTLQVDVFAENIPALGLGTVQFRLSVDAPGAAVAGVPDLSQALPSDVSVATPLLMSAPTAIRSGLGEFFLLTTDGGKVQTMGGEGILVMDNETLTDGTALYTYSHTFGSSHPDGAGIVASFMVKVGSGATADNMTFTLSEVRFLDGGVEYTVVAPDPNDPVNTSVFSADVEIYRAPADVTDLTAIDKAGDETGTVVISWTGSVSTNVAGYKVYSGTTELADVLAEAFTGAIDVSGLTIGTETVLRITAYDAAGNESPGVTVTATALDDVSPVVTAPEITAGGFYDSGFIPAVTVTDSGTVTTTMMLTVGGVTSSYIEGAAITADGDYTLTVDVEDSAGNTATFTVTFTIDGTAPVTTITASDVRDVGGVIYVSSTTDFTIAATDAASGIASSEYSLDGGTTWTTYAAPFTLTGEGSHTIGYRSTDNVGNAGAAGTYQVVLDDTAIGSILSSTALPVGSTLDVTATVTNYSSAQQDGLSVVTSVKDSAGVEVYSVTTAVLSLAGGSSQTITAQWPITDGTVAETHTVTQSFLKDGVVLDSVDTAFDVTDFRVDFWTWPGDVKGVGTMIFKVNIFPLNGFKGEVNISTVSLPVGLTAVFSSTTVNLTPPYPYPQWASVNMEITVTSEAQAGVQDLTVGVQSAAGPTYHEASSSFSVLPGVKVDYVETELSIEFGGTATYDITFTPMFGYEGELDLTHSVVYGADVYFTKDSVTLVGTDPVTTQLVVDTSNLDVAPGRTVVSFTCTCPGATGSRGLGLAIEDFRFRVGPSVQTLREPGSVTYLIKSGSPNYDTPFTSPVHFSVEGLPDGMTYSFEQNDFIHKYVHDLFHLTITAADGTEPGNYKFIVRGAGPVAVHEVHAVLNYKKESEKLFIVPDEVRAVGVDYVPDRSVSGDFNKDGFDDIALTKVRKEDGARFMTILHGSADGAIVDAPAMQVFPILTNERFSHIIAKDLNNDGYPDLLLGFYNTYYTLGLIHVYFGKNPETDSGAVAGTFDETPVVTYTGRYSGGDMVVGKFDGDDYPDAVHLIGSSYSMFKGNGDGTFTVGEAVNVEAVGAWPVTGDFNDDGKLDFAAIAIDRNNSYISTIKVYHGDGLGAFAAPVSYAAGRVTRYLTVADFNGDGYADLGASTQEQENDIVVLLSDGAGAFLPAVKTSGDISGGYSSTNGIFSAIYATDMNGDGMADLITHTRKSGQGNDQVVVLSLLSNGDGTFSRHKVYAGGGWGVFSETIGDFNGDGAVDLAMRLNHTAYNINPGGLIHPFQIMWGEGGGAMAAPEVYLLGKAVRDVAHADFDGDGNIDAVVAAGADGLYTLKGNGDGTFQEEVHYDKLYYWLITGHFNDDEHPDLVGLRHGGTTSRSTMDLYLGTGSDTLTLTSTTSLPAFLSEVDSGDMDGDGLLDIVTVHHNYLQNMVAVSLNNGDGTFQPDKRYWSSTSIAVAIDDFNGDGKADVVTANGHNSDVFAVLLGTGSGELGTPNYFSLGTADFYSLGTRPVAVESKDINEDGNVDLTLGVAGGGSYDSGLAHLLGNGDGTFSLSPILYTGASLGKVVYADFDDDGIDDIAQSGKLGIYLGSGDGTGTARNIIQYEYAVGELTAADVNNDHLTDMLVRYGDGFAVFMNRDRVSPATTITVAEPKHQATDLFVTSATEFTLAAGDVHSGVDYTEYRIDGGGWNRGVSFSLAGAAEGSHTIEYYSVDTSGNSEQVKSLTVVVDETAPATTITASDARDVGGVIYVSTTTDFTIAATDAASGIASSVYSLDGGTTWTTYAAPFTVTGEGSHTIDYRSTDNVGNVEATGAYQVVLDDTALSSILSSTALPVGSTLDVTATVTNYMGVSLDGLSVVTSVKDSVGVEVYSVTTTVPTVAGGATGVVTAQWTIPAATVAETYTVSQSLLKGAAVLDTTAAAAFDVSDFKLTVYGGGSMSGPGEVTVTVNVDPLNGFNQPVTLSIPDLPQGMTASFSSNDVTPPSVVTITIDVTEDAPKDINYFTIVGQGATAYHEKTTSLTMLPSVIISSDMSLMNIELGDKKEFVITVTPIWGYSSATIDLVLTGTSPGFASLSSTTVNVGESTTLVIDVRDTIARKVRPATYGVGIKANIPGTGEILSNVTVEVVYFVIGLTPPVKSLDAPGTVEYDVYLRHATAPGQVSLPYSYPVNLTVEGLPAGATYSFSANGVVPNQWTGVPSKLWITMPEGIAAGSYNFKLNGQGPVSYNHMDGILRYQEEEDSVFIIPDVLDGLVGVEKLVSGDFNADGKDDIAVLVPKTGGGVELAVVLAGPDRTFSAPVALLPVTSNGAVPYYIKVADFNNDTYQDILVGPTVDSGAVRVFLNDGTKSGTFLTFMGTPVSVPYYASLAVGHYDDDTVLDVAAKYGSTLMVLKGNMDGTFTEGPAQSTLAGGTYWAEAGDFNGDGKTDFAHTYGPADGTDRVRVYMGDGSGGFSVPVELASNPAPTKLVADDFDNDGITDLASIDIGGTKMISVWFSLGSGSFLPRQDYPVKSTYGASEIGSGDFNGDGFPDIVVSSKTGAASNIYLSNGSARNFADYAAYALVDRVDSHAVGDFDGDNKYDMAYVLRRPTGNPTVLNYVSAAWGSGDGSLQAPSIYLRGVDVISLTNADLNNDGSNEILALSSEGFYILTANGDGSFLQSDLYPLNINGLHGIRSGDFDGDTRADDFIVTTRWSSESPFLVYLNDIDVGGAILAPIQGYLPPYGVNLSVVDMNGDGKDDLVSTNYYWNYNKPSVSVSINGGGGSFLPYSEAYSPNPIMAAAADFDEDGKTDVAVTNGYNSDVYSLHFGETDEFGDYRTGPVNYYHIIYNRPAGIGTLDFNSDMHSDLVMTVKTPWEFAYLGMFPGIGTGLFGDPVKYSGTYDNQFFADFDGNKVTDVLAVSTVGFDVFLATNDGSDKGNGTMRNIVGYWAHGEPASVGDFNNDAMPDLVTSGASIIVYINGINPIPTSFDEVIEIVRDMVDHGDIDSLGVANAIISKLENADKALTKDQETACLNLIDATINLLEAQSGGHITVEAATELIGYLQGLKVLIESGEYTA